MIRVLNFAMIAITMLICFGLYRVTHAAQEREAQLAAIEGEIAETKRAAGVLKAEFSLLSQPAKIEALTERHLELQPTRAQQVAMRVSDLPWREQAAVAGTGASEAIIDGIPMAGADEKPPVFDDTAPTPAPKPRSIGR
jgi:cell division protein FtsL